MYHWFKAVWQSLPFMEKYRATELHELDKALKTQIFFLSGYLVVASLNTVAAIIFPADYSLRLFNVVESGLLGGMGYMLFDCTFKTLIAFHKLVARRRIFRLNQANVKCLRLIASSSENIPGPKHIYNYRDLSIDLDGHKPIKCSCFVL